ncbi:hypothetical protein [Cupriavidus basilensis]
MKLNMVLLPAAMLLLSACGGTETEVETIDVPKKIMAVDHHTLGFWTMRTKSCLSGQALCVHDRSRYGNDLVLEDSNLEPISKRDLKVEKGMVDDAIRLNQSGDAAAAQLRTMPDSTFSSTRIGDTFTFHIRFKAPGNNEAETLLSLGSDVFSVEVGGQSSTIVFPSQGRRLLVPLAGGDNWNNLYISSDGNILAVKLNCVSVNGFTRSSGDPFLSMDSTELVLGARPGSPTKEHFTGELDFLRVSDAVEKDLFCN